MATDALLDRNGELAELSPETKSALDALLPPSGRITIRSTSWATPAPTALGKRSTLLRDAKIDAVLVILSPQAMTDPREPPRRSSRRGPHA